MIDSFIKNIKKPIHAILVENSKCSDFDNFLNKYIKKIVSLDPNYNLEVLENKLNNNSFENLININTEEEMIKKDDILKIQNIVKTTNYENTFLFVVLNSFEKSNKQAFNSFLKTLEEPNKNICFILRTNNINKIAPTIKSRCEKLTLQTNYEIANAKSKEFNVSLNSILESFDDVSKLEMFDDSESIYFEIRKWVDKTLELDFKNSKELLEVLKTWNYTQISFAINLLKTRVQLEQASQLIKLNENLNLNPIKTTIFFEILKILGV